MRDELEARDVAIATLQTELEAREQAIATLKSELDAREDKQLPNPDPSLLFALMQGKPLAPDASKATPTSISHKNNTKKS